MPARCSRGERAYGGEIFKLTQHTERLHESARLLGFTIPWTVTEIDKACNQLLAKQGFSDAYVRPIAWRGSEMMGVSAQKNSHQPGHRPSGSGRAISIPNSASGAFVLDMADWRRPDPRTAPSKSKAAGLYMI